MTIGLPAMGVIWLAALFPIDAAMVLALIAAFPAVATVMGAPVYLLFGAPALWLAIERGASLPVAGFVANLVALPFVTAVVAVIDGAPGAAFAIYGLLGSLFAMLWSAIFVGLYQRFSGERIDV
jgi:hypothetical protein